MEVCQAVEDYLMIRESVVSHFLCESFYNMKVSLRICGMSGRVVSLHVSSFLKVNT